MTKTPTTVAELRAQMAEGCRKAAVVYHNAARDGLRGASDMARRLEADAERNAKLAKQ